MGLEWLLAVVKRTKLFTCIYESVIKTISNAEDIEICYKFSYSLSFLLFIYNLLGR